MRKKSPRRGTLADYIAEILKNAVYEKGEQLDVIVAEAPDLPGCLTQGATVEQMVQLICVNDCEFSELTTWANARPGIAHKIDAMMVFRKKVLWHFKAML